MELGPEDVSLLERYPLSSEVELLYILYIERSV